MFAGYRLLHMVGDAEVLLTDLRRSPTDLIRIVRHVLCRQPSVVWLPQKTAQAWAERDPEAWARVRLWLQERGVSVRTVEAAPPGSSEPQPKQRSAAGGAIASVGW
jgi:hypothetical protein